MNGESDDVKIENIDEPDVLLWFIWAIQQYAEKNTMLMAAQKYGEIVQDIIVFIRKQNHPRMLLHTNGLLYVDGKEKPATWMNAVENGRPITARTGYVVEINALWFNVLKFAAEMNRELDNQHAADLLDYQAEITRRNEKN